MTLCGDRTEAPVMCSGCESAHKLNFGGKQTVTGLRTTVIYAESTLVYIIETLKVVI